MDSANGVDIMEGLGAAMLVGLCGLVIWGRNYRNLSNIFHLRYFKIDLCFCLFFGK
jgi:hypothetical protein